MHISFVKIDFNCPKCTCLHKEEDYYQRFYKHPSNKVFYMKCKGCKTKLGVDFNYMGNVVVWLKEDEVKI